MPIVIFQPATTTARPNSIDTRTAGCAANNINACAELNAFNKRLTLRQHLETLLCRFTSTDSTSTQSHNRHQYKVARLPAQVGQPSPSP